MNEEARRPTARKMVGCRRTQRASVIKPTIACLAALAATQAFAASENPFSATASVPPLPGIRQPLPAMRAIPQVPYQELSVAMQDKVRRVIAQPTLSANGPVQNFSANPLVYAWLLDHPDRVVTMWRRLGARCLEITDRGDGWFGWSDHDGSDVRWQTALARDGLRVWYAEGASRPLAWLPTIPFRAVVILRSATVKDNLRADHLRQEATLYVQTDSKAAMLLARMLGPSAPRMAEQCMTQLEIFFSGIAWYLERYPDQLSLLVP
jgi:hypothetical protein